MHPNEVKIKAGQMIAAGKSKREVAEALDVPYRTLMSWVMEGDRLVVGGDPLRGHDEMNAAMRAASRGDDPGGGAIDARDSSEMTADDRVAAAREAGLRPEWASRLVGSTREELLADARALAAAIPDRRPVPGLGIQGAPVSAAPSMNDLIRAAAGRVVTSL
jgi:hypothetical protein